MDKYDDVTLQIVDTIKEIFSDRFDSIHKFDVRLKK
jgi:hypothetical protein